MADIEEMIRQWETGDPSLLAGDLIRALLKERKPRGQLSLHPEAAAFSHRFDWIWPSLKNRGVTIEKRGHKMTLVTPTHVKNAKHSIRTQLEKAVKGRELPLFGTNEVRRELIWHVKEEAITVTWRNLGADYVAGSRKRDLVNIAALLDDAAGRERIKGKLYGPGVIYRDDSQIAETYETRRPREG